MSESVWLSIDLLIFYHIHFDSPIIIHIIFLLIYSLCQNKTFKLTTTQQIEEF